MKKQRVRGLRNREAGREGKGLQSFLFSPSITLPINYTSITQPPFNHSILLPPSIPHYHLTLQILPPFLVPHPFPLHISSYFSALSLPTSFRHYLRSLRFLPLFLLRHSLTSLSDSLPSVCIVCIAKARVWRE